MIVGGFLLPFFPKRMRSGAFLFFPLYSLFIVWTLPAGIHTIIPFLQYDLVLASVDKLSRLFGVIFCLTALTGGIYAFHLNDRGQQGAALVYGGSALGVTFAGDLLTLFIFWEIMAISSTYLVWARRTVESEKSGMRYLLVHLFGGSALLAGILLHLQTTGNLVISRLEYNTGLSSILILVGVGLNAAIPPLHAWLSDAYPRATVTGAVFMSAFTTKSAVYLLARLFPGWEILTLLGVIMALYGVVYAVLANDIREILAYHIISQVGYMVAGVGIGTELALNGTAAHAYSHILYKSLLFMGAGAVLHTTGKSKLTELGGLAQAMPLTLWLYMIGAFSISGFPLFNGFISKSMVVSAAGKAHIEWAYLLLTLASVGTFLHTGLKLPYFTWFGESRGLQPSAVPINMHIGMAVVAFFCTMYGVAPGLLYGFLPFDVTYEPYTIPHLVEATQILLFTFVAFWMLRGKLAGEPLIALDTDWFYRRPAPWSRRLIVATTDRLFSFVEEKAMEVALSLSRLARNPFNLFRSSASGPLEDYDPDKERWPLGFFVGAVLACIVVIAGSSLFR
jgi:multicomponent Na+:H+ antiporter subunit D